LEAFLDALSGTSGEGALAAGGGADGALLAAAGGVLWPGATATATKRNTIDSRSRTARELCSAAVIEVWSKNKKVPQRGMLLLFNSAHFSPVTAKSSSSISLFFPQMGLDATAFLCGVLKARCALSVCTEAFHAAWFAGKLSRVITLAQKSGSVVVRFKA
jgi:hypothetical protein